jgi:hypothetical protein
MANNAPSRRSLSFEREQFFFDPALKLRVGGVSGLLAEKELFSAPRFVLPFGKSGVNFACLHCRKFYTILFLSGFSE